MNQAFIIGTGHYVPERVLTNADLEKIVDTSDEWITARTGIKERRIEEPGTPVSAMSEIAARRAIEDAGIEPSDLDLLILGTVTPDSPVPAAACRLQARLGVAGFPAMDVNAGCTAFIYALALSKAMIETGQAKTALAIGTEQLTYITDWTDRNTCVLFGDASGAAVVSADAGRGGRIVDTFISGDGSLTDLLYMPGPGTGLPISHEVIDNREIYLRMAGSEVFKHAVKAMGDSAELIVKRNGLTGEDIDLLIPHQANMRIMLATAKRIKLPKERVFVNIHKYGNTSSATVPVALDEARKEGRTPPGSHTVMVAFGAGFTWGSVLVEWV
jgi:3-oxoacyl-[acyl-carrier-protein] synthase-3